MSTTAGAEKTSGAFTRAVTSKRRPASENWSSVQDSSTLLGPLKSPTFAHIFTDFHRFAPFYRFIFVAYVSGFVTTVIEDFDPSQKRQFYSITENAVLFVQNR
jgi:hypothetical protein